MHHAVEAMLQKNYKKRPTAEQLVDFIHSKALKDTALESRKLRERERREREQSSRASEGDLHPGEEEVSVSGLTVETSAPSPVNYQEGQLNYRRNHRHRDPEAPPRQERHPSPIRDMDEVSGRVRVLRIRGQQQPQARGHSHHEAAARLTKENLERREHQLASDAPPRSARDRLREEYEQQIRSDRSSHSRDSGSNSRGHPGELRSPCGSAISERDYRWQQRFEERKRYVGGNGSGISSSGAPANQPGSPTLSSAAPSVVVHARHAPPGGEQSVFPGHHHHGSRSSGRVRKLNILTGEYE